MARVTPPIRNRRADRAGREYDLERRLHGDIYPKGAAILHSLRWLVGDDAFFELLYRFANDERFA